MSSLHTVKTARKLIDAGLARYALPSLDAPVGPDPDAPTLGDLVAGSVAAEPTQEIELLRSERRRSIVRVWRELGPREREIIVRRFAADETLEEVGLRLDLSRERVRQLERSALARLRSVVADGPSAPAPAPRGRAPREGPAVAALRTRLRAVWDRLRNPALLPNEKDRLEAELRQLRAEITAAEAPP